MENFPDYKVRIFGYLPPKMKNGEQVVWYLSVLERPGGVVDTHPNFRPWFEDVVEEKEVRLV